MTLLRHPFRKDEKVIEAVAQFLRQGTSPGRAGHRLSRWAEDQVWDARDRLASLLNASNPDRVTFGLNATMALNAVANHLGRMRGRVLTSAFEHNSVSRPLHALHQCGAIEHEIVPPAGREPIDLNRLEEALASGEVAGVVTTWASNVTGTIMPIAQISDLCRQYGVFLAVDAAQAAGYLPVDAALADVFVFAGHKGLGGPPGVGGAVIGDGVHLEPFVRGGSGGRSEGADQPRWLPWSQEAGTANGPGIAGLAAALRTTSNHAIAETQQRHSELRRLLRDGLTRIDGVTVVEQPSPEGSLGVLSFTVDAVPANAVGALLEEKFGILVRTGLHCAPMAHRTIGTIDDGTVRLSFGHQTCTQDIKTALEGIEYIVTIGHQALGRAV